MKKIDIVLYHHKYTVNLEFGQYKNGRVAIECVDAIDGDPICVATVNIPDEHIEDDEVIIKNWSENEGILDELIKANIIGPSIRTIQTGFVVANVCKLLYHPK